MVDSADRTDVLPVFVQQRNLPGESETAKYSVHEICQACEKTSGHGTVLGPPKLGSLWRFYPRSTEAQTSWHPAGVTLAEGRSGTLSCNPVQVNLHGVNRARLRHSARDPSAHW